jgi:hypothetical protein
MAKFQRLLVSFCSRQCDSSFPRVQRLEFLPEVRGVQELQQAEFFFTEAAGLGRGRLGQEIGGVMDKKTFL